MLEAKAAAAASVLGVVVANAATSGPLTGWVNMGAVGVLGFLLYWNSNQTRLGMKDIASAMERNHQSMLKLLGQSLNRELGSRDMPTMQSGDKPIEAER